MYDENTKYFQTVNVEQGNNETGLVITILNPDETVRAVITLTDTQTAELKILLDA